MNAKEVAIDRVKRELVWLNKGITMAYELDRMTEEVEVWVTTAEACKTLLEYWNTPREKYGF